MISVNKMDKINIEMRKALNFCDQRFTKIGGGTRNSININGYEHIGFSI